MPAADEAFAKHAREFCDWIESEDHDVVTVRRILLDLMRGVFELSTTGEVNAEADSFPQLDHADWSADITRLRDLPLQYYRLAFDPLDLYAEASVVGDICDDLADIHAELAHGLRAFDSGASAYAVSHWRESYRFHWGLHATGALTAIDAFLRSQGDGR